MFLGQVSSSVFGCLLWLASAAFSGAKVVPERLYADVKQTSTKDMFVNQWAVVLVDHAMASEVALRNGFFNLGEVRVD